MYNMYHSPTASAKCILTPIFYLHLSFIGSTQLCILNSLFAVHQSFSLLHVYPFSTVLSVLHCHAQHFTIPVVTFYIQLSHTT